jgi:hypothetical protein
MPVQLWPKKKISGKHLYNLSEEEYRTYMRERLSEAKDELYGPPPNPIMQILVTLILIAMAGVVCLHHFGVIKLDK